MCVYLKVTYFTIKCLTKRHNSYIMLGVCHHFQVILRLYIWNFVLYIKS